MARNYAQIVTGIWSDPDWCDLSPEAQRMFLALLTQPKITMVGSLDYIPKRWAMQAKGISVEQVEAAMAELVERRYVFVDHEVDELVIRTFVKHDGSARSPSQRASMWGAWGALASPTLKQAVLGELPDVAWETNAKGVGSPPDEALSLRSRALDSPADTPADTPSEAPTDSPRYYQDPDPYTKTIKTVVEQASPASTSLALVIEDDQPGPVEQVFDAWRASTGKSKAKLDKKRSGAIKRALKDYPIEDLLDAVDGWRYSPHHRGENDRQTVYNSIELLLSDAERIEKFRDLARAGPTSVPVKPSPIMAANARRAAGDACPDCGDTGWIETGPVVTPCACQEQAS